jgi:hypothetical protein
MFSIFLGNLVSSAERPIGERKESYLPGALIFLVEKLSVVGFGGLNPISLGKR